VFDDFRLSILGELVKEGIESKELKKIMDAVDRIGVDYDVKRKEANLVPIDQTAPRMLLEYLACRSLEGLSDETLKNYKLALAHFLSSMKKPIQEIEGNDIRMYLFAYQQTRDISNRSLDKLRNTISSFFHWAFNEGRIQRDPSTSVRPIKHSIKHKTALSQLELEYIRKCSYTKFWMSDLARAETCPYFFHIERSEMWRSIVELFAFKTAVIVELRALIKS
jgi:hypothetical protein